MAQGPSAHVEDYRRARFGVVGLRAPVLVLLVLLSLGGAAAPVLGQGSLTVNPSVSAEAPDWLGDVQPGVPTRLVVLITNHAASPDSFRVAATVDANGWEASPERTLTRTLAPAGTVPFPDPTAPGGAMPSSVEVNVTVVPPTFAPAGAKVPISVIVASTNSTSAHDVLTVNATVLPVYRVAVACSPLRLALVEGASALVHVTVSNLGNAADEIDLVADAPGALFVAFEEQPVLLGAGTDKLVVANVSAAPDSAGSHDVEVRAQSARDRTAGDFCRLDVVVASAPSSSSKDSPAAAAPLLAALVIVVALALRRRRPA